MSYVKKRRHRNVYDFWTTPEGVRLVQQRAIADRSSFPIGCGVAEITEAQLEAMRELCENIVEKLHDMVPWGDGWVDKKQRGYGLVPEHSKWKDTGSIVKQGILMHDVDSSFSSVKKVKRAARDKHNFTIKKSFTDVELNPEQLEALHAIIELVKGILHAPQNAPHLQQYELNSVDLSELVAIQPNIHNGDDYLPLHLDNPRHDGFGVVIVTLALWGSGDVVLVDDGDPNIHDVQPSGEEKAATDTAASAKAALETTSQPSGSHAGMTAATPQAATAGCDSFEGGILYENGKFTCTEEKSAKMPRTDADFQPFTLLGKEGCEVLGTLDNCAGVTALPSGGGESQWGVSSDPAPVPRQEKSHEECQQEEQGQNSSNSRGQSIKQGGDQNQNHEQSHGQSQSQSKSWAFPLHPGQLYVLSGPSRNKCAHGVVVAPSQAQVNTAQDDIATASTQSEDSGLTSHEGTGSSSSGGSSNSGGGGLALPYDTFPAFLPSTCAQTSTSTSTSGYPSGVVAAVDPLMFRTDCASNSLGTGSAASAIDPLMFSTTTTTATSTTSYAVKPVSPAPATGTDRTAAAAPAPLTGTTTAAGGNTAAAAGGSSKSGGKSGSGSGAEYKKGRVSLNFRFGLHTAAQAWDDIDRHWG